MTDSEPPPKGPVEGDGIRSTAVGEPKSDVPRCESVIHLLLARAGDSVEIDRSGDPFEVTAIVRERDLREKRVRLARPQPSGKTVLAWRTGEAVQVQGEGEGGDQERSSGRFRVADRELGLTPETWRRREADMPLERYREVRIDEAARSALVSVLGWFASTWGIDEDVGNGAWRKRRDEVLAAAYRMGNQGEDGGSFTIETIERDITQEAIDHARAEDTVPFEKRGLAALERQIESPGLHRYDEQV